jgi:hypothetical protein
MMVGRMTHHKGDRGYVVADDGAKYAYRGQLLHGVEPGSRCEFKVAFDFERQGLVAHWLVAHSARLTAEAGAKHCACLVK